MGGDFQVAGRLIPAEDTSKFLSGRVVDAVVDLKLLEERTAVGIKSEGLDWKAGSDDEGRRKDAVKLVVFLLGLVWEPRCAKIFVCFPLGDVGGRLFRATISWRVAVDKLEVPRNVLAWVCTEGVWFPGGVLSWRGLEGKMYQAFLNEGRAGLGLWVLEAELVGEVRTEFLGVGKDELDGAVQLGLDGGDGLMLGLQELAKGEVLE